MKFETFGVKSPNDDTFKMLLHFLHLWTIGQKGFLSDIKKMKKDDTLAKSQARMSRGCRFFAIFEA